MTADVEDGVNTITNGYDIGGRLLSIDAPGTANDATFAIDALGRFKSRTILGATDTYSYLGTSETVTRIVNAASADSLVDAGGGRLGVKVGTSVNWFLPDPHGNVAGSLSGTIVANALRYDAYGQTLTTGSAGGTQVATGYWKHQARLDISPPGLAQPLYEAGARLYSPGLGTFTSLDTFAGTSQDPLSLNRYLYAEANPATLVDPTGHFVSAGDSTPGSSCKFIGDWGCGQTAPTSKSEVRAAAPKPTKKKGADHGNGHGATWRDKGDERHTPWVPPSLKAWLNFTDQQRDWYINQYLNESEEWDTFGQDDASLIVYWMLMRGDPGLALPATDVMFDLSTIDRLGRAIDAAPRTFDTATTAISFRVGGDHAMWDLALSGAASQLPASAAAIRSMGIKLPAALWNRLPKGLMRFLGGRGSGPEQSLGDLTPEEVAQIQRVVDDKELPITVVGSAARSARTPTSDIDYVANPRHDFGTGYGLPGVDPSHGIIPGFHNPFIGPGVRFEPGYPPYFIPGK